MFYITISNGLLTPAHKKKMGSAVWEFMWCIDKVTKIDEDGVGWVLGGKPIKLHEIGMGHDNTTSRNLTKLEEGHYIKVIRTPHGLSIRVNKAKKRFTKSSGSPKVVVHQKLESTTENSESLTGNGGSNKTVQLDTTSNNTEPAGGPGKEIAEVIKSFETVNPASSKWYANKTQRAAVERLLKRHGLEKLLKVVEWLNTSNRTRYMPTITSPLQLEDKWATLEAAVVRMRESRKGGKLITI